jgi:hypothetical protein
MGGLLDEKKNHARNIEKTSRKKNYLRFKIHEF